MIDQVSALPTLGCQEPAADRPVALLYSSEDHGTSLAFGLRERESPVCPGIRAIGGALSGESVQAAALRRRHAAAGRPDRLWFPTHSAGGLFLHWRCAGTQQCLHSRSIWRRDCDWTI